MRFCFFSILFFLSSPLSFSQMPGSSCNICGSPDAWCNTWGCEIQPSSGSSCAYLTYTLPHNQSICIDLEIADAVVFIYPSCGTAPYIVYTENLGCINPNDTVCCGGSCCQV